MIDAKCDLPDGRWPVVRSQQNGMARRVGVVSLFCNPPAWFFQEEVNEPGQEVDS